MYDTESTETNQLRASHRFILASGEMVNVCEKPIALSAVTQSFSVEKKFAASMKMEMLLIKINKINGNECERAVHLPIPLTLFPSSARLLRLIVLSCKFRVYSLVRRDYYLVSTQCFKLTDDFITGLTVHIINFEYFPKTNVYRCQFHHFDGLNFFFGSNMKTSCVFQFSIYRLESPFVFRLFVCLSFWFLFPINSINFEILTP